MCNRASAHLTLVLLPSVGQVAAPTTPATVVFPRTQRRKNANDTAPQRGRLAYPVPLRRALEQPLLDGASNDNAAAIRPDKERKDNPWAGRRLLCFHLHPTTCLNNIGHSFPSTLTKSYHEPSRCGHTTPSGGAAARRVRQKDPGSSLVRELQKAASSTIVE